MTKDFRSDTLTTPTDEMREAMATALVGDDVYGEDPTVNNLEKIASELLGKDDALFVPSGTMGNQIALLCHTSRGQEIILEKDSHIYKYEVGGLASISGLQACTLDGAYGKMSFDDISRSLKGDDIHEPSTGLIALENTHNMAGGIAIDELYFSEISKIAKSHNIPLHLDGARIFNSAIALNVDVKDLVKNIDSVMFCLSKGLCAPVGSVLVGNSLFISKARKYRKMLGGGMRQAGIIASAGIIAITKMVERLKEDHSNAKALAKALYESKAFDVELDYVHTNIVMAYTAKGRAESICNTLKENGVLSSVINDSKIRFVTHKDISSEDIDFAIETIKRIDARLV